MVLRLLQWCASAALLLLLLPTGALAEKRVALVIGNSKYVNADTLVNPARDAQSIADMLRAAQAHFDVVEEYENLDNQTLHRVARAFASKHMRDADVAVVYYAGHGIQHDGHNYLIPIDAQLDSEQDIEEETISLDRILETLKSAKRLRVVILDACRDNPFEKRVTRRASRSYSMGLAIVEPAMTGTVIAFAAKGGSTADDGDGAHSPFTTALLEKLMTPGIDVRTAFDDVHDLVKKMTRGAQEPFTIYSLDDAAKVELVPARERTIHPPISQAPAPMPAPAIDRDYDRAASIGNVDAWKSFLDNYEGLPQAKLYLELARAALKKAIDIEKQKEDERAAREQQAEATQEENRKRGEAVRATEAHRKAEEERKQAEARAEEARKQAELSERRRAEETRKKAELTAAAEAARKQAELTREAEAKRKAELARAMEDARKKSEEAQRAEEARKIAEAALRADQARRQAEIAKRAEDARRPTMLASTGPAAQIHTSSKLLESKAQDFLDDYIRQSQGGLEEVTAYTKRAYAAEADYYGSRLRNQQIVNEQRNYARTWPQRTFQVRPGSTRIACDATASVCDLTGEIDFHDVNPEKSKSSTGVASFELRVLFAQSEPKILSENGKVLSRQTGSANGNP